MFIEKSVTESRTFNLDDADELSSWNALLDDPNVKIIEKKFFNHTETEVHGRNERTETKDQRVYAEWERCSL